MVVIMEQKYLLFKEALLQKDAATLLALFPFMLQNKESERAMSYIEGQLRLQLMVSECKGTGLSEREVQDLFKNTSPLRNRIPLLWRTGKGTCQYEPWLNCCVVSMKLCATVVVVRATYLILKIYV